MILVENGMFFDSLVWLVSARSGASFVFLVCLLLFFATNESGTHQTKTIVGKNHLSPNPCHHWHVCIRSHP